MSLVNEFGRWVFAHREQPNQFESNSLYNWSGCLKSTDEIYQESDLDMKVSKFEMQLNTTEL